MPGPVQKIATVVGATTSIVKPRVVATKKPVAVKPPGFCRICHRCDSLVCECFNKRHFELEPPMLKAPVFVPKQFINEKKS